MPAPLAALGTLSAYEVALGDAFLALDPEVRRAHLAPLAAAGSVDVEHGSHWVVSVLVKLLKLPDAGRAVPVRLEVTSVGDALLWSRRIGVVTLRTWQHAVGSCIVERAGLGSIVFGLRADNGALLYRQRALKLAGIPVPAPIAPQVEARVSPVAGAWHVDVRVTWRTHIVCRYGGRMAVV